MSTKFNQEVAADITELKKLRRRKDKSEYNKRKKEIADKHGKTVRTVELWLKKPVPGMRDQRSDAGKDRKKVTAKDKRLAAELSAAGLSQKETANIIELKTGNKVSNRQIKKITDAALEPDEENAEETKPSNFGDSMKEFIKGFFELDLVAPGYGVEIKIKLPGDKKAKPVIIPLEDCEDICLILANVISRMQPGAFKIDREQLRRASILHLVEQQVRLAKTNIVSTKTVGELVKMQKDLTERLDIDTRVRVVEKVCKELKSDISFTEIVSLIRKHSTDEQD